MPESSPTRTRFMDNSSNTRGCSAIASARPPPAATRSDAPVKERAREALAVFVAHSAYRGSFKQRRANPSSVANCLTSCPVLAASRSAHANEGKEPSTALRLMPVHMLHQQAPQGEAGPGPAAAYRQQWFPPPADNDHQGLCNLKTAIVRNLLQLQCFAYPHTRWDCCRLHLDSS